MRRCGRLDVWVWVGAMCALGLMLAGCAQTGTSGTGAPAAQTYAPAQYYPPPGPADDPWGPYIAEAASRYGIPAQWIRAVMAQESAGEEQAVSPAGAIGLMQVMPETYDELREENGLGDDPFNPHDNILAGAAYIKEMYDRYGSPGFLAAYNAGPSAVDDYLAGDGPLPDETQNYLAAVMPNLGTDVPFSGPLAQYAQNGGGVAPTATAFAMGCDVNAAYDPDHPCAAAPPADFVQDAAPPPAADAMAGACDADLAYDPDHPCMMPEAAPAVAVETPAPAAPLPASAVAAAASGSNSGGAWAVQVGAYASAALARAVAEGARTEAPQDLGTAAIALPATSPFGGTVLYQARLTDLSAAAALDACSALNRRQLPCVVIPALGA